MLAFILFIKLPIKNCYKWIISVSLTLKYIKNCLTECISEEEQVNVLMQYIKENREYKFVGELKRNYK